MEVEAEREFRIIAGTRALVAASWEGFLAGFPAVARLRIYPNPMKKAAMLSFSLHAVAANAGASKIRLSLCDFSGRNVRTFSAGTRTAGTHTLSWDARDGRGRKLPADAYRLRLEADGRLMDRGIIVLP